MFFNNRFIYWFHIGVMLKGIFMSSLFCVLKLILLLKSLLEMKLGVQKIILEGDALEVVQALRREDAWKGRFCMFVEEVRRNLQQIKG